MKFLVTGGHGFIGTHLVNDLKSRPAIKVIAPTSKQLDVANNLAVYKFIKKHKPDVIYHLAAILSKDNKSFRELLEVNVDGTLNILNQARKSKIILMGSFEGPTQSNYGFSKDVASKLGNLYHLINKTDVTIIKPTIVYGPGQKGDMFIPSMMHAELMGKIFQMSKGKQKRDFVYIDDVIDALVKVLDTKGTGDTIEIGSGKAIKIIKLTKYMVELAPWFRFNTNKTKIRKGEVKKIQANLKKAKDILNWKPKVNIKDGLRKTLIRGNHYE